MNGRFLARFLCYAALVAFPTLAWAQAESSPPREFPAFRGTWTLDESAGRGHIGGLPLARTLAIATTPTEISLVTGRRSSIAAARRRVRSSPECLARSAWRSGHENPRAHDSSSGYDHAR